LLLSSWSGYQLQSAFRMRLENYRTPGISGKAKAVPATDQEYL